MSTTANINRSHAKYCYTRSTCYLDYTTLRSSIIDHRWVKGHIKRTSLMTTARHKTLTVSIKTKMLKIQFTQTCVFNFNSLAVCVNKGGGGDVPLHHNCSLFWNLTPLVNDPDPCTSCWSRLKYRYQIYSDKEIIKLIPVNVKRTSAKVKILHYIR